MNEYLEVPLIAGLPDQQMDITLDGKPFSLRVTWNERFSYWTLSIYHLTGESILSGIKMVKNFPLLQRYQTGLILGEFIFFDYKSGKPRPDFDSVGNDHTLIYIAKSEL